MIDKHCNLLKNDVSAGIVDKGETVYSDFANQFGFVFSNRLSLLSSEILAHIESVKYATNSEETDKLTNDSGSLHIHCHSENVAVSESTLTENDTRHDLSNIQQETDNLVDHTDEERLVSSSFNHDRQKSCSNTQAALNDDINCPSTPTFTDQMEDVGGFEQDIEPSVMNDTGLPIIFNSLSYFIFFICVCFLIFPGPLFFQPLVVLIQKESAEWVHLQLIRRKGRRGQLSPQLMLTPLSKSS